MKRPLWPLSTITQKMISFVSSSASSRDRDHESTTNQLTNSPDEEANEQKKSDQMHTKYGDPIA